MGIFCCTLALANTPKTQNKIEITIQPVQLNITLKKAPEKKHLARVYIYKNARVNRALRFIAKNRVPVVA